MLLSHLARFLPAAAIHALLLAGRRGAVGRQQRTLRLLARHKRWADAQEFLHRHPVPGADRHDAWLPRHVQRCAALAPAAGRPEAIRARLAQALPDDELLATRPLPGGIVNMAMYLHRVRSPAGEERAIVEKVSLRGRRPREMDEAQLFAEMDHRLLLAPRFFGEAGDAQVRSLYHAYVPGRAPSRAGFARVRNELVATLWQAAPTQALLRAAAPGARRAAGEAAALIARHPGSAALARCGERVAACLEAAAREGAAAAFVLHDDLHAHNCLRTAGGSCVLVDWDRFRVAPVGFGLVLTPDPFATDAFRGWLAAALRPLQHLDVNEVLACVAMDQVLRCAGKGDLAGVEAWARELDRR